MADETHDNEERTEEATPQRREQARERGQLARSRDLVGALTLLSAVLLLGIQGEALAGALLRLGRATFGALDQGLWGHAWLAACEALALACAPIFGATTLVALCAVLVQTGVPQASWFAPDLARLNPLPRLAQILKPGGGGWELAKTALKLGAVSLGAYQILRPVWDGLADRATLPAGALLARVSDLSLSLLTRLGLLLLLLSGLDYVMARFRVERELRMSRHEVREELRHSEGNPQIKRRLRRKARELMRRRLSVDVPKADVVVVNPTHVAVALSYKAQRMRAPVVVAKGADSLAMRIRELARGAGVPVVQNPPLARDLNRRVPVGREVPSDLYRAVAEILAFVYRIKNRSVS